MFRRRLESGRFFWNVVMGDDFGWGTELLLVLTELEQTWESLDPTGG